MVSSNSAETMIFLFPYICNSNQVSKVLGNFLKITVCFRTVCINLTLYTKDCSLLMQFSETVEKQQCKQDTVLLEE